MHLKHVQSMGSFLWGQYNYALGRLQLVSEEAGVSEL
jgi:hypothetical protein